MFDANFYRMVLPETVRQACQNQAEHVPVVELHLPDSLTLDLCHIETLANTWLTVVYYRNPNEDNEVDRAFLPYQLVQWVTVSMHPPHVRHIGFDVARSVAAAIVVPAFASPVVSPAPGTSPATPPAS
ncbi:MAG TPA: hypothetical protein VF120_04150 [Ktedonobacterales bacterium]